MATINFDIAETIRATRESIEAVYNARNNEKEKRKNARMAVYCALSLHPALDSLHFPTLHNSLGALANIYDPQDRSWPMKWFQARDKHFGRLALLGSIGQRARVMLILLWVIGHRLSDDKVESLISQACEEGIDKIPVVSQAVPKAEVYKWADKIVTFRDVLVSLRKTIKKRQPMKKGCNPFEKPNFKPKTEREPILASESYAMNRLSIASTETRQYDVWDEPGLLLRMPQQGVLIPKSHLTGLIINWCVDHYGLAQRVSGEEGRNDSIRRSAADSGI
ncbi:hypothetical protein GYMLUDRAFT_99872 [Collybiopsis luxurians FD-317 M1]|uniref:Unplaced genomic scaffold GYMLUscaffold_65, whole genome shotgun sequence n=1 Tax=Collybiopsis luxurians FD-317 M1 TaxID=944289 RepID=A0A0D0BY01_9AGAR|nr:hypothetical protein GYMLUDRAFT_99872 [Collybiopsis luxurians FD-317 M1]